ncbi:uncharacterized protein LOC127856143 isoform X3 [Dreissena polymorpha]|uniref:ShKT domain-containing protein n=1 Tax=Dreissena polymorpha TaxID=45954 RepID=A0A9D4HMU3_DREPO|nr:uncharacterized protein LOC127856143 isoform X3 [Dreissena polymorpha]XP_052248136.1 uncharacterized protein LOC127856143 isoform X3 [Dreissena polymorpha]KAH3722181.1 hypothetical protein DPMN_065135 [Dreissena polymorpha]
MTTGLIIVLYLTSLIPGVPGLQGATIFCKSCHSVDDPANCHVIEACHDGYCGMEVHTLNGVRTYKLSCKDHASCEHQLIGKRGPPHHGEGILECKQCCQSTGCEKHLCQDYHPETTHGPDTTHHHTTTKTPTTTAPPLTFATTTHHPSTCVNLEGTDFRCADLDQFHFCSDVNSALNSIAKERCPLHCGFCGKTTSPTSASPCLNQETSDFHCADLDQFNFCSDVNSGLHSIAKEKCPLHCGFCGSHGVVAMTAKTTHLPTVIETAPTKVTSTLGNVDITVNMGTAFTLGVDRPGSGACVDIEDSHFQCSYWKSLGYCAPDTVPGYQVSLLQCRKTCDLCDV